MTVNEHPPRLPLRTGALWRCNVLMAAGRLTTTSRPGLLICRTIRRPICAGLGLHATCDSKGEVMHGPEA